MVAELSFKKTVLIRQEYMQEQGIAAATGLPEGQTLEQAIAAAEAEGKAKEA